MNEQFTLTRISEFFSRGILDLDLDFFFLKWVDSLWLALRSFFNASVRKSQTWWSALFVREGFKILGFFGISEGFGILFFFSWDEWIHYDSDFGAPPSQPETFYSDLNLAYGRYLRKCRTIIKPNTALVPSNHRRHRNSFRSQTKNWCPKNFHPWDPWDSSTAEIDVTWPLQYKLWYTLRDSSPQLSFTKMYFFLFYFRSPVTFFFFVSTSFTRPSTSNGGNRCYIHRGTSFCAHSEIRHWSWFFWKCIFLRPPSVHP